MRQLDADLMAKIRATRQTPSNGAQPKIEAVVTRTQTPITHATSWQEAVISEDVTTVCTSVAAHRTGAFTDYVYVAYVTDDNELVVKRAPATYMISKMAWTVKEEISGCVACAIEYNGEFRTGGLGVEYYQDDVPWLFYTTTDGELWAGPVGGPYAILAASGATQIDTVRGIRSAYGDMDQGLIVFYVLNSSVYYRQYINGAWEGQEQVTIAPENAVKMKAERLFDYRICLHITDSAGVLWEVFTKPETSGWNGTEYLRVGLKQSNAILNIQYSSQKELERIVVAIQQNNHVLYAFSPVMTEAENIDQGDGDYGHKVRITFDQKIFNPMPGFSMSDSSTGAFASTEATKISDRVIEVTFVNFNNAVGNCTITYTPGSMTGEVVPLEAGSVGFTPTHLVPYETEPPAPVSVENIEDWSGSL